MKVAITAQGKGSDVESEVDPRFGRAQWIIVVDTETDDVKTHDNAVNLNAVSGAGVQTASNVVDFGAEAVITGNVGPKAFRTLSAADVRVFLVENCTVKEAVDKFKKGELREVDRANVESHWV